MAVEVAQRESSRIKRYASAFSIILISPSATLVVFSLVQIILKLIATAFTFFFIAAA